MLFLHALLFIVLGTGTSAFVLRVPIKSGMVHRRDYGYWGPMSRRDIKYPLIAYIGPIGDQLVLDYGGEGDLSVACSGERIFVRILNADNYVDVAGEDRPSTERGVKFHEVNEKYKHDKLRIRLLVGLEGQRYAEVQYILSLNVKINYIGLDYERRRGYWKSEPGGDQVSVVAYIDPAKDDSLVIYYYNYKDVDVVCNAKHFFVRLSNVEQYRETIGEKYSKTYNGPFPSVKEAYKDDQVTIIIIKAQGTMTLIEHSASEHFKNTLSVPITYIGMNYLRGHGYWLAMNDKLHVLAYIGPNEGDSMVLHYDNMNHLNYACITQRYFERIMTPEEYKKTMGKEYPSSEGQFPSIQEAAKRDQVTVTITGAHATVKLIEHPALDKFKFVLSAPIKFSGDIAYERGHGYWQPMSSDFHLLAYIGEDNLFVLYYDDEQDINKACDTKHYFWRISEEIMHQEYPSAGQSPTINADWGRDRIRVTIHLEKSSLGNIYVDKVSVNLRK